MKINNLSDFIAVQSYRDKLKETNRDHTKWHLSGLGSCPRKRIYQRLNTAGLNDCPKSLKNFAFGNMIHSYIQTQTRNNPSDTFRIIGEEITLPYHDQGISFGRSKWLNKISGHADLLVEINGKNILYELKSIHYLAMNRYMKGDLEQNLTEAYPWHHAQLSGYVYFMRDAGFTIDEAKIVYICKSNMFMVEVPLQMTDVEAELEYLEHALKVFQETNTMPPKIPSGDRTYWQCDYCQYRQVCRDKSPCTCEYCLAIAQQDPLFEVS